MTSAVDAARLTFFASHCRTTFSLRVSITSSAMVNEVDGIAGESGASSAGMPATSKADIAASAASAASAAADSSQAAAICATVGCGKPATLACPGCLSLSLPPGRFCSQSCFTSSWKQHVAAVHKPAKERLSFQPPAFDYTGPLRPHYVTARRSVPAHIQKPDYADSGIPRSEMKVRGSHSIHIHTATEIAGMRAVNKLGRLLLDYAHSLVRAGMTTEELDRLVHDKTVEHNAYPSPLNYNGFPKACCTSVNECICQPAAAADTRTIHTHRHTHTHTHTQRHEHEPAHTHTHESAQHANTHRHDHVRYLLLR